MAPAAGLLPILKIAVPAIVGAAGVAGSVLSANAARKNEQNMFDRLHPAPTEDMLANMEKIRSTTSTDAANQAASENPFARATAAGMDRLAGVRQKLQELQVMNQNRIAQSTQRTLPPSNPFLG